MKRVLIAGIGNVFFGDDAFGVEVARHLRASGRLPKSVVVADYGIRTLHLSYALLEPVDLLIVVDLTLRGGTPGTLYVLQPNLADASEAAAADAHGMDLHSVFSTLRALGGRVPRVLLVGCEPGCALPGMGLSPRVAAAVPHATSLILELVTREEAHHDPTGGERTSAHETKI